MRPVFVVNPIAGGGRAPRAMRRVRSVLEMRGMPLEAVETKGPGDAQELARRAAADGFSPIVAVGGDGTVHEVVNGLLTLSEPPDLAVIPVGKGNDFARNLGLPRSIEEAAAASVSGASRSIDVGRSAGRWFVNAGGVGFDARVSAIANRGILGLHHGTLAYALATLAALRTKEHHELTVEVDDRVYRQRSLFVAVAVGRFYGGGMMICPQADYADGLLEVCLVGDVPRLEVLRLLPTVYSGGHVRHPNVQMLRGATVRVTGPASALVHLDGENHGHAPAEFDVAPGRLRVRTGG